MGTKYTAERDQQERNMDQLQLTNNNLTQERDHFQARNTNLTAEKNDVMAKINILTAEKEMLQKASGWRCSNSSCYYISTSLNTWNDSKQHCMDLGGHLVIIDSEEEQKFISGFKKRVWIGAMETEGTWKWVDGKVLGNAEYWGEGEPNDYQGREEDCAEIFFLRVPLRNWNDVICNFNNTYICEKAM
ncbi:C-type lectin domain family 4 member E-like [Clupea harengus]|uniref:C-type lectin domain family 4 member E-like n=1 Tax=Clupea harengus TaxID=7950 RepID=A0A8M1KNP1_CLUHA|nr:C-type lectin domain family 4 member E-like [Clupea harengus]